MNLRNIFLFWVGKEYSLISLLRKLIILHSKNGKGYKVILLNNENISNYISNIPENYYNLKPAHQADFIRVNIICEYGGIWLDSDTLVIDKLDSLFDLIELNDGFFIKENNKYLCNGIFGSNPNTDILIEWKNKINNILNKNIKFGWNSLGSKILNELYKNNKNLYLKYKILNGLNNIYPVNYDKCVEEFINKPYNNYKQIIRDYQPLIILVNSVYKKLENKSEEDILNENIPLNYFIKKSFENIC
jgi:mannosyltransferase OCH1-like enzyme